jgi:carbamate kinase
MRIVVALGGNALLKRGETPDAEVQKSNVKIAVRSLAKLAREHELVITHGNGPQVGVLALQSESDPNLTTPYPFDVIGAQTQGMIGYWLLQSLQNALPGRQIACILNQTLVSASDPAFADPTKFIGETYDEAKAKELGAERRWTVKQDGAGWRRVIGSPEPRRVVETRLIRFLLDAGTMVVCAGGGGVPVVRNSAGQLEGVEAVVDKDFTTALLAEALDADALLILTDVSNVFADFGTPEQQAIGRASPQSMRERTFPHGSMGPKVDAACRFVEHTGAMAGIGHLDDALEILLGTAGTIITPSGT